MTYLLAVLALGFVDPPAGTRVDLGGGATLFVPDGFKPISGAIDVLLHLHGTETVVEPAFVEDRWPGVLITFNRKGLSKAYAEPFSDKTLFPELLRKAIATLKEKALADDPTLGRVVVSSFSAGFGGVRKLLKVPEHFDRIDGLILLDSLYCGYSGDPSRRQVDPALMAGFRRFAIEAAAGRKTFLITHSAQVPDGYASTTETADDLIRAVGGSATASKVDRGDGWIETRSFAKGKLLILGFSGVEGADHLRHLRRISELWDRFLKIR
jgi:hypothetical protein